MNETLGQCLQTVRKKLGFLSARSFYIDLAKRADLSFNYSYYMKIEANQLTPSEKVISQLAGLLPGSDGDLIVATYCSVLFPHQMKRLLNGPKLEEGPSPIENRPKKAAKNDHVRSYQMELTEKQVAIVASTKAHYFLFLVLTLSRRGISKEELSHYHFEKMDLALEDLCVGKLIYFEDDYFFPSYPEFVFPKPETTSLKNLYQKINAYDLDKNRAFGLAKIKRASFFKRISPRQAEIILMHLDLLFQTIRTADEIDVNYNTEVLSLDLSYHQGKILG
ncbi:MAG: helix-turn-helix domain-containing protein [Bacteriovorax sp.]